MSFAHPWLLLLLLVPLALVVAGWRRHGQEIALPFDHSSPGPRRTISLLLRLVSALPALLLAVAVVILAGPQKFGEPRTRRVLTNIEFLVDVSGSMTAPFGDGNRYDAAMANILEFIDAREGDAFGLSIFGTDVLHWVPLTTDPNALRWAPEFLSPLKLPRWFGGGTLIGMGLQSCLESLSARADGDRMIILLTDGYSADLSNGRDAEIARKLRDAGITVFCIHIDNTDPPPEVQLIASMTGGETFVTGDPEAMKTVFQKIDGMKRARMEKMQGETVDDIRPWALAGGGIVLLSVLSAFGLRYTPW